MYIALVLVGACLGSFAGATVWRLRARQLERDKKNKVRVDAKEYNRLKKLTGKGLLKDRSQCLHCGYELKWYDLIPVVSWIALRGRCRECRTRIGWFELLIELGTIAFFVLSYAFWPLALETGFDITHFILWLGGGVALAILFSYDLKWFLLPDVASIALAVIGVAITIVSGFQTHDPLGTFLTALGAIGVLSGLYLFLYLISRGRWIGFGDIKLGVGLALLLTDWQLALVALFLANVIGCLVVIPFMIAGTLKRNSHVPFGPLLITGTVLAWFIGWPILNWYLGLIGV